MISGDYMVSASDESVVKRQLGFWKPGKVFAFQAERGLGWVRWERLRVRG